MLTTVPLWLLCFQVPTAILLSIWVLFPNQDCDLDGPQNWWWYNNVYDMAYNAVAASMLCFVAFDLCLCGPLITNWTVVDKCKLWPLSWATFVGSSYAIKYWMEKSGLIYDDTWAWPLCKLVVVVSCTAGYCTIIPYVWCRIKTWEEKKFFLWSWILTFLYVVWALALYYHNQAFVVLYKYGQQMILASEFHLYCPIYDFVMAGIFIGGLMPAWAGLRDPIVRPLICAAGPIAHDQLAFLFVVQMESFSICFGRVIFANASSVWVLLILLFKDSFNHVLQLAFFYRPRHLLGCALKDIADQNRHCKKVVKRIVEMFFELDIARIEECLAPGTSADVLHNLGEKGLLKSLLTTETLKITKSEAATVMSGEHKTPLETAASCDDFTFYNLQDAMARRDLFLDKHLGDAPANVAKDVAGTFAPLGQMSGLMGMTWTASGVGSLMLRPSRTNLKKSTKEAWIDQEVVNMAGVDPPDLLIMMQELMPPPQEGYETTELLEDKELEVLADRIVTVQKNLRLRTAAVYLAHLTSSILGFIFLQFRSSHPCTLKAYGLSKTISTNSTLTWTIVLVCDLIEALVIFTTQYNHRVLEDDDASWKFMDKVMWNIPCAFGVLCICAHIVMDTYLAMYIVKF